MYIHFCVEEQQENRLRSFFLLSWFKLHLEEPHSLCSWFCRRQVEAETVHIGTPERYCVPTAVLLQGSGTGEWGVGGGIRSDKVQEFEGGRAEG